MVLKKGWLLGAMVLFVAAAVALVGFGTLPDGARKGAARISKAELPEALPVVDVVGEDVVTTMGLQQVKGSPLFPDFTVQNLAGKSVKLSDYRGKVILLNFWATWCPPCRAEMPTIEKVWQQLKNEPNFIWLAIDAQENPTIVKAFLAKNGYHFPVLVDTTGEADSKYGVQAIPTTYLIDRSGRVLGGTAGGREWDTPEVLRGIQSLLSSKP